MHKKRYSWHAILHHRQLVDDMSLFHLSLFSSLVVSLSKKKKKKKKKRRKALQSLIIFFFFFIFFFKQDDHSRIQLVDADDGDDYINASPIVSWSELKWKKKLLVFHFHQFDSDRKYKYIATQGPMATTTNAFWQMVWEQGSTVIVALARPSSFSSCFFLL